MLRFQRYKELVEKQEKLRSDELAELLDYGVELEGRVMYDQKETYLSLIQDYLEGRSASFEYYFLALEKKHSKKAEKIFENYFKYFSPIENNSKATKFAFLISDISDECHGIRDSGVENYDASNFREILKQIYLKLQALIEE